MNKFNTHSADESETYTFHTKSMDKWEDYLRNRKHGFSKSSLETGFEAVQLSILALEALVKNASDVEPTKSVIEGSIANMLDLMLIDCGLSSKNSELETLIQENQELKERIELIEKRCDTKSLSVDELKKAEELIQKLDEYIDNADVKNAQETVNEMKTFMPDFHPDIIRADVVIPILIHARNLTTNETTNETN